MREMPFILEFFPEGEMWRVRVDKSPVGDAGEEGTFLLPSLEEPFYGNWESKGGLLFDALFQGKILNVYQRVLAKFDASPNDSILCICLKFELNSPLLNLPWEYLRDPHYGRLFLARNQRISITRWVRADTPIPILSPDKPLRVAITASSPIDKDHLGTAQDIQSFREHWVNSRFINPDAFIVEPHLTVPKLKSILDQNPHVFYFGGHGLPDTLFLEYDNGQARPYSIEDFCQLISDTPALKLIVLNVCEGALQRYQIISIAYALIQAGVPAVVAMQAPIADKVATVFGDAFSKSLITYRSLERALFDARNAIKEKDSEDWGLPVLLLRSEPTLFIQDLIEDARDEIAEGFGIRETDKEKETKIVVSLQQIGEQLAFSPILLRRALDKVSPSARNQIISELSFSRVVNYLEGKNNFINLLAKFMWFVSHDQFGVNLPPPVLTWFRQFFPEWSEPIPIVEQESQIALVVVLEPHTRELFQLELFIQRGKDYTPVPAINSDKTYYPLNIIKQKVWEAYFNVEDEMEKEGIKARLTIEFFLPHWKWDELLHRWRHEIQEENLGLRTDIKLRAFERGLSKERIYKRQRSTWRQKWLKFEVHKADTDNGKCSCLIMPLQGDSLFNHLMEDHISHYIGCDMRHLSNGDLQSQLFKPIFMAGIPVGVWLLPTDTIDAEQFHHDLADLPLSKIAMFVRESRQRGFVNPEHYGAQSVFLWDDPNHLPYNPQLNEYGIQ